MNSMQLHRVKKVIIEKTSTLKVKDEKRSFKVMGITVEFENGELFMMSIFNDDNKEIKYNTYSFSE